MTELGKSQLNNAQQQAVNTTDGTTLVVAGAGTGKTRVITERILRLIQDDIPAKSILALTFTEKAAGEMLERVEQASLQASMDTTLATFNGFGNDLLTQYGVEWGIGSIQLLGEIGQLVFIREHFDEFELDYFAPISSPNGQIDSLRRYVSLLKQQLVAPERYATYANQLSVADPADALEKKKQQELARFYKTYLDLCRQHHVIDYDDQVFLSVQLLRERPNILRDLQQRYRYILVDEFQDTNPMQSALIDLLAGEHKNLMVVGDDDQSIYGWRGATLANILNFKKRYPDAADITLIENYRSTQSVLDAAYKLIQHNNPERLEVINKLDKRLHAQNNDGPTPIARHFYTFEGELTWVAEDIANRVQNGQDPASIAILGRTNAVVDRAHQALELHGVPHIVVGMKSNMYDQPAVRQLIETLRAISDPLDNGALFNTLSGPLFELPQGELSNLAAQARREHGLLSEMIERSGPEAFQEALRIITEWREHHAEINVGNLAYSVITDSGWKTRLAEEAQTDSETYLQVQALGELFKTFKEFERVATIANARSYLDNLPTLMARGSDFDDNTLDISDSLVNVMSAHKSKGLEWNTVYIINCVKGSFPMNEKNTPLAVPSELRTVKSAADEQQAEERRLMYVAITRARKELIITHSDKQSGGVVNRKPSPFLKEMFGDGHEASTIAHEDQASLELFAPRKPATAVALPETMLQDGIITLSASQIECWLKCPQDFYYKHVLHMPEPQSPAAQYGTAIHGAIQTIFEGRRTGIVPTLDATLEQVKQALPQSGYETVRTKERAHAQAEQSVRNLYERFVIEDLPIEVEKPFNVQIPDLPLKIKGRIDAVYAHSNGAEIRDFKTSTKVTTLEQAKSKATNSQQLTIYALAWQIMHGELPALLTLDYVETGQLGSVKKTQRGIDGLRGKLTTLIQHLEAGEFPPAANHDYCSHPH